MASLRVEGSVLRVELRPVEVVGSFHGSFAVPVSAIRGVWVTDQPLAELRGIRAPGTGLPGVIMLGTWRYRGGKDFVALYARQPAIVVDLHDAGFNRLLLSMPDPEYAANLLQRYLL